MKKKKLLLLSIVIAVAFIFGPLAGTVNAQDSQVPPEEIEDSIVKGLAWLDAQQNPDGSWGGDCNSLATTSLAVLKLETRAIELGLDPLASEYEYSTNVQNGLGFIMSYAQTTAINSQPAGNPDGDGDGMGLFFDMCGYHQIYNTGISMMALAASGHPELYGDDLQDAVDFMAWAQADDYCGIHRGGWRYSGNDCASDNSNAGYVTLGLGFAEAPPPFGFGLTIPEFVKQELNIWIDTIQDDVDGDSDDGGSWYDPSWSYPWVNSLKTGNLIFEMVLVGDTAGTPRLQDAVDYLERHWQDTNVDPGWGYNVYPANYQAMFILKKGLDFARIPLIDLDGDNTPEHDWFMELATVIVTQQNQDGSWPGCHWGDPTICTTWALLALEPFVPPSPTAIDVKPGSCPNPLNTKGKGVLPVAILGLSDFDITQIDPSSVRLFRKSVPDPTEVTPLRWSLEDAGIPYEPFMGRIGPYDCLEYYPDEYGFFDGYLDLSLKFKAQEVVAALGEVHDGDVVILLLTGRLKEEFGGTGFVGEDVVWIIEK